MTWVQAAYTKYSDKHMLPPLKVKVGDNVWLLRHHVKTIWPLTKLDIKCLGKFKIIKKVFSHTYKLDLLATMKIHPVFYISLLKPTASDPLPSQIQPPLPPIIVEDKPEWEVDEIVDLCFFGYTLKYLV